MFVRKLLILSLIIFPVILFSCKKDGNPDKNAVAATLYDYTGLDGCSWVVDLEDGSGICEIAGFPDTDIDIKDSIKVWVTYQPADTQISICMVGPRVKITGIWERD